MRGVQGRQLDGSVRNAGVRAGRQPPWGASAYVGSLLVAPGEAVGRRHLVDDGMALGERMRAGVAALRLAASDVAAGGTQPQVETAAAFLAAIGLCVREYRGDVIT